jgi:hypothetical protein
MSYERKTALFGWRLLPLRAVAPVGTDLNFNVAQDKQTVLISQAEDSRFRTP